MCPAFFLRAGYPPRSLSPEGLQSILPSVGPCLHGPLDSGLGSAFGSSLFPLGSPLCAFPAMNLLTPWRSLVPAFTWVPGHTGFPTPWITLLNYTQPTKDRVYPLGTSSSSSIHTATGSWSKCGSIIMNMSSVFSPDSVLSLDVRTLPLKYSKIYILRTVKKKKKVHLNRGGRETTGQMVSAATPGPIFELLWKGGSRGEGPRANSSES